MKVEKITTTIKTAVDDADRSFVSGAVKTMAEKCIYEKRDHASVAYTRGTAVALLAIGIPSTKGPTLEVLERICVGMRMRNSSFLWLKNEFFPNNRDVAVDLYEKLEDALSPDNDDASAVMKAAAHIYRKHHKRLSEMCEVLRVNMVGVIQSKAEEFIINPEKQKQ